MPAAKTTLAFIGATPYDARGSGDFIIAGATETILGSAPGPIGGVQIIAPAAVTGPVIVTNKGPNGVGTAQVVNFAIVAPDGTAFVSFQATARGPSPKPGDVLTISGVPAGSAVRLVR